MSSLYRDAKDGQIIEIICKNKHINEPEINLECVIITFNHRFLVFNVCCGPRLILISTSGRNKRTPQTHD